MRKPTKDGHVTSLEAYDANGEMIIQFFGKRHEGEVERDDWRFLAENLPRVPNRTRPEEQFRCSVPGFSRASSRAGSVLWCSG